jgi:hypothetical protein
VTTHESERTFSMMRRLALAATLALAPLAAAAQELSLQEISNHLNSFRTGQGGFTQVNADGSLSTGTIYIKRPGRIRFEYNENDSMFIAGAGRSPSSMPAAMRGPSASRSPRRRSRSSSPRPWTSRARGW